MLRSLPGLPWLALSGLLHLAAVAGLASGALREAGPAGALASSSVPEIATQAGDAPARAAPGRPRPGDGPVERERSSPPRRTTPQARSGARPETASGPGDALRGPAADLARAAVRPGVESASGLPYAGIASRLSPGPEGEAAHATLRSPQPSRGASLEPATDDPGPEDPAPAAGASPCPASEAPGPAAGASPGPASEVPAPADGASPGPAPGSPAPAAGSGPDPAGGAAPDPPAERPARAAAPDRPTGRLALMALGTHKTYQTGPRHRYELLVVSPEKHEKAVLKRARKAYPDALVFAYLNTMDVMLVRSRESPKFWKKREDWFLHDADGERVRVRVRGYKGPRARYGMNVAHPGWQRYLGARAVEFLEMGYDGVQLDNVETDTSYRLYHVGRWISAMPVEMTEERWYRAEEEMLRVIRTMADEAGFREREIIFNHIRAGEPERAMDYLGPVDGANSEGWMNLKVEPGGRWGWRSRVDLIRRAGAAGKRTNVLALASLHSPEEALFAFASYLMAYHGEDSTFWYGKSYRAEQATWFWFYDAALGEPAGEMEEIGTTGVFARPFTHGLVVVNPQEEARTVTLDAGPLEYMDEAFEPAHRLELRPKEGKILRSRMPRPAGIRIIEAESCLEVPPERREGALKVVRDERWSADAALEMGSTSERCVFDASLPAGPWRLVVEGTGQGRSADAALVSVGGETRRAAFGFGPRQVQEIGLRGAEGKVTLRAAEAGVIVDRIVLIPLSGER